MANTSEVALKPGAIKEDIPRGVAHIGAFISFICPKTGGGVKQADIHVMRGNFSPFLEFLLHIVEFGGGFLSLVMPMFQAFQKCVSWVPIDGESGRATMGSEVPQADFQVNFCCKTSYLCCSLLAMFWPPFGSFLHFFAYFW